VSCIIDVAAVPRTHTVRLARLPSVVRLDTDPGFLGWVANFATKL